MEETYRLSSPASRKTSTTTTSTSTRLPSPEGSKSGKSKKSLKRFPRVLKAILFETSLAKKLRKRRNAQKGENNNDYLGAGNVNSTIKTESNINPQTAFENGGVESNDVTLSATHPSLNNSLSTPISLTTTSSSSALTNSTFSSTNSSTTTNSSDKTLTPLAAAAADAVTADPPKIILLQQQQQYKVDPTAGKGRYSSNVGLCLVVVSLMVLMFWGKICAIMFTSTWLFFVPHCIPGTGTLSGRIGAYYRRIDPDELKKDHVVATTSEGFVERNRNRARRWVVGLKGRS
ncbi:hypothetical protein LINPERPRIM_LOCUS41062 [Linum perenne]